MLNRIKYLYKDGFFHIFGGSVFSQVGGFVVNIFVTRMLSKADYGEYVSALNIYGYFALFIGIGFLSGIMQFCAEPRSASEKAALYRYSRIVGSEVNGILFLLINIGAFIIYGSQPLKGMLLAMMGLLPFIVYLESLNLTIFRIHRMNQIYAYLNVSKVITSVVFNLALTKAIGVQGLILAQYAAEVVALILSQYFVRTHCQIPAPDSRLDKKVKRDFIKFSLVCCLTNMTSTILVLLDITCIDAVIGNPEATATYKIASTIPTALMFIPASYITYIYPIWAEAGNDVEKLKKLVRQSLQFMGLVNGVIAAALCIAAPLVVKILWGDKYADAVGIMQILTINYFIFGTFRKILGNIIVVLKKVWVNLAVTSFAGVANIVLNLILIKRYQSVGAALATVLVSTLVSMLTLVYYLAHIKKNGKRI